MIPYVLENMDTLIWQAELFYLHGEHGGIVLLHIFLQIKKTGRRTGKNNIENEELETHALFTRVGYILCKWQYCSLR
jgi:hypothetical protein